MAEQLIKELRKCNTEKIKDLLLGAPINWGTYDKKSGRNILQLAIESEDPEVFRLIVSAPGVNLNLPDKDNNETPLQTAILVNNPEFVEVLLDKNANPFLINKEGLNAVHKAVLENLPKMLETMLKKNVDINSVKCTQGSLLNMAIANGQQDVAHWLLSARHYKVNLSSKDEGGNNCLLLAVKENSAGLVERILEYIDHTEMSALEKELFVNTQDENGDSILHIAYRQDFQSVIKLLESRPIGLNHQLKNLKKQTIKDIIQKKEEAKQAEVKSQQKLRQAKRLKQKQKHQLRQRLIEKAVQEELQRKEHLKELKRLQKQKIVQKKESEKKTRKHILIGVIVILILLYFWLDWAIKSKKSNANLII